MLKEEDKTTVIIRIKVKNNIKNYINAILQKIKGIIWIFYFD